MKLKWMVYRHDINKREIVEFNIFNHGRFLEDVKKDLKKYETKEEFAERLRGHLFYYYGSKCEWEVVITSWVPHITMSELDRINAEREETKKKYDREPYRLYVNPDVGKKIDVYEQVRLNWDLFVDYVWSNKRSEKSCEYCSGDYDQEITAIVHRFHSSSDVTQKGIRVKYCPNCGRELY